MALPRSQQYSIKKYADNGENPKLLGSFNENDTLYVLSSKPTAKYSKWDVLGEELQKDEKFDFRTPALAIKYPNSNTPFPVGSANDIDDIFIEVSGTGAQIKVEDFPLYKALKEMNKKGYSPAEIEDEILKHSNGKQRIRLIRIFQSLGIIPSEETVDGGDNENPRGIENEGWVDMILNGDVDQQNIQNIINEFIGLEDMQVEEERNGGGAD